MSADAGVTLADLTTYLHSRLAKRERFVRIGDVLRMIHPQHEAPPTLDDIARDAADERDDHLDAVQERYDRALTEVAEDGR